jgi:hypothetical protein
MNDIEILCASCHQRNHNGKLTNEQEIEMIQKYDKGLNTIELAKEYNVNPFTISLIIKKIKNNLRTSREANLFKLNGKHCKYTSLLPQIVELAKQGIEFKDISNQLNIPMLFFYKSKNKQKILDLANKDL